MSNQETSFYYSKSSRAKLNTVASALRVIFEDALALGVIDIYIDYGARSEKDQTRLFNEKKSKVKYPNSKHNIGTAAGRTLSAAVDAVPYIPGRGATWDPALCCILAGLVLACAKHRGVSIRWGGNWDADAVPLIDQDFDDLAHYEIAGG